MRRASTTIAVAVATVAAVAGSARADFTPDTLVSGSSTVQADYGGEPVIAADGGYVVFVGSYLGVRGIWRKNLATGALEMVAAGDANGPSVSANGQFVSFTTTSGDPATGGGPPICPGVWVRDMSKPVSHGVAAFALASALDGSSRSIDYAGASQAGCLGGGSAAAPRVALSADGNEVAFTVDGQSDLTTGDPANLATAPAQVALRYLGAGRTVLVSQTMTSLGSTAAPVANGAALTDGSAGLDVAGGVFQFADPDSTAAVSADGSTVAWQGIEIPAQAPASAADAPLFHPFDYTEPLWRRVADGPDAPTRRVTGGDDPLGPCPGGCAGPLDTAWTNASLDFNPTQAGGPISGTLFAGSPAVGTTPFGVSAGLPLEDATPQLSADGRIVAILSTQPSTGQDPPCGGINNCGASETTNAFVADMAPGLGRTQALTRLTQWANDSFGPNSLAGTLDDLAISPDGTRVGFTTVRTVFPWSPPALISAELSPVEFRQLYVADLADGTLEVASLGYDGQPANGDVLAPSFSAGNGPIAFASQATNLVFGALSSARSGFEVFTTTQVKPPAIPGESTIGAAPPNPVIVPDARISATARATADGGVIVSVTGPGRGRLGAALSAGVPSDRAGAARRRRRRRHAKRSAVATVTIARAARAKANAGVVDLRLTPGARYRPLIARAHGLYATVRVTFAATGRRALSDTLPVDLRLAHRAAGTRRHHGRKARG